MKTYKQYKAVPAETTINQINNILYELGISMFESHRVIDNMHSCRLAIANNGIDKLNIGTNGKGATFSYSKASGYAEFLERLENKLLISRNRIQCATQSFIDKLPEDSLFAERIRKEDLILNFKYDPEEEYWPFKKVIDHFGKELKKLYSLSEEDDLYSFFQETMHLGDKTLMVPAYSVSDQEKIMIPIDLVMYTTGSNGMCAGNTPIEAILQGICEIYERQAISEIFYKNLTPPTIDIDYFKNTPIYEKIQHIIERTGYEIIVKDCSLGIGLPVIGTLIIDRKNLVYNFKLGADFVPHVALERCLTEVYQSAYGFRSIPLQFNWEEGQDGVSIGDDQKDYQFHEIIATGSGFWPYSVLLPEASYEFKGFDELLGQSNYSDFEFSVNRLKELGLNLYIRDNSILDFPAYFVIIPGFSQTNRHKRIYEKLYSNNVFQNLGMLAHLGKVSKEEAMKIAESIMYSRQLNKLDQGINDYFFYNIDDDLLNLDTDILLTLLYYYTGNFVNAKSALDRFLSNKSVENYKYYYAASDYLLFKYIKNQTDEIVEKLLSCIYGSELSKEIIEDMYDPDKIFQYHDFPTCFECEKCKVEDNCRLFDVLQWEKLIHNKMLSHPIDQNKLFSILKNHA